MSDEQSNRNTFSVPQRRAGKRFKEITARRNIDGVSVETTEGTQLAYLPIQVNITRLVPKVFRLPMQAGVTAASALARAFGVKFTFGMREDEF